MVAGVTPNETHHDIDRLEVASCHCTASAWTTAESVRPVTVYRHQGCGAIWANDDGCQECGRDGEVVTEDGCPNCLSEFVRRPGWYCEPHDLAGEGEPSDHAAKSTAYVQAILATIPKEEA